MKKTDIDPWAETPVVEREGYQLRNAEDAREEWRTILIVTAVLIILSAIAAESVGRPSEAPPVQEIHSK